MFYTLFAYPEVRARHQNAPLAPERVSYLKHLADQGSPKSTLQRWACMLLMVIRLLDLPARGARKVSAPQVRHAARRWAKPPQRGGRSKQQKCSETLFVRTATAWLRFLGQLRGPPVRSPACQGWLDRFVTHLTETGKASATIGNYRWQAQHFLRWWHRPGRRLRHLCAQDLDRYFQHLSRGGWGRVSLASAAKGMRQWVGFAAQQGWCSRRLAARIESPRLYQDESLPTGPAWAEVQRLLAAVDTLLPRDIRNRAMLLLLACYGFRSSEVRHLRLADLDWEQGRLRLRRAKSGAPQEYPLTPDTALAVLAYLRKVRPRSPQPELFLTLKAPHRPLSAGALYHFTSHYFRGLDIYSHRYGPHALRHACATHLRSRGFSLKEIGDHLGHRSVSATRVYAKVDLSALRQVANLDLGGLL
jgi:integrase/recombinase XerD